VKIAYDKAMSAVVVVIILIVLLVAAVLVIVCVKRRRRSMSQRREGGRSEEMHYPGSEEAVCGRFYYIFSLVLPHLLVLTWHVDCELSTDLFYASCLRLCRRICQYCMKLNFSSAT